MSVDMSCGRHVYVRKKKENPDDRQFDVVNWELDFLLHHVGLNQTLVEKATQLFPFLIFSVFGVEYFPQQHTGII